jgi:alkaline phosphatase D
MLLQGLVGAAGMSVLDLPSTVFAQDTSAALIPSDAMRPRMTHGVMSGDVMADRAIIWSRADRSARLVVEYSYDESMKNAVRRIGPAALEASDFTARIDLTGLEPGRQVFYRAWFQGLENTKSTSEPSIGRFRTAPARKRDIVFTFSGDEAGQGFGINEAFGGYRIYEEMRKFQPDFFIHSGDQIYADGPLKSEVTLPDGTVWKNIVTPEKSKVAETLAEYRGNFAYNLLDTHKRRFASEVPFLVQWDDHEVRNNWYPGQLLGDERYKVKSASLLSARARQAMFEYNPMRIDAVDPERIYRKFQYGPSLDVFMLDERSYRGPNTANMQTASNEESAFLGAEQMAWLKKSLLASKATWKAIASDMPLSLVVPDLNPDVPKGTFEAWANGDGGPPAGRELEVAELLRFIKKNQIRNVVWFTADVHYAQATYYNPVRAAMSEFDPFWEFVAGPINAGTFGPNELDRTFGPEVRYLSVPADNPQNRAPTVGQQYFGVTRIDGATEVMRVSLHDLYGKELYSVELTPDIVRA